MTESGLSAFELKALSKILAGHGYQLTDKRLGESFRVVSRQQTGVGIFTTIKQVQLDIRLVGRTGVNAPTAVFCHPALEHDGLVSLWIDKFGRVDGIEAVTFAGEDWPGDESPSYSFE